MFIKKGGIMERVIQFIIIAIGVLIVLALIGLEIYVWVVYGNKPAGEVPLWALWLLFGHNK